MKYWVWSDNKTAGPYSAEELGRLPGVGPKTLVRRAGTADQGWTPLEKIPSLMEYLTEIWGKEGAPPPPPSLCWKCGSVVDDDAVYCDHCGGPNPHERPVPEEAPLDEGGPASALGRPTASLDDLGSLVGTALLVVGGFVGIGALSSGGGDSEPQGAATAAQEPAPTVPTVAYANKIVEDTLDLRNFRWNEYGELAFEVHFKGNVAERGALRFEVYDERGIVIFSGVADSFSGGANKKVFEERILMASERRRRAHRIVFDF